MGYLNNYFYIYNFEQAKYFINKGLYLVEIKKTTKGDIYHKFIRDKDSEQIFLEWKKQKYGEKAF